MYALSKENRYDDEEAQTQEKITRKQRRGQDRHDSDFAAYSTEASEQRTTVAQRHSRSGKEVAATAAFAPAAAAPAAGASVTSSKQMSFAQMSHAPNGKQWDTSPRYRQIDVEEGIAGNQKLPYQNEASTFRTSRHQRYPGAEAIDGPNAGATPDDLEISQDDYRIQESDMPSATKQMAVAAEIAPDEDEIEAEVNARLRQHTDQIAAQIQQRILGDAVQADVVDSPDPSASSRKRRRWIAGGALIIVLIGLVVALIVVFTVPKEEDPPPASTNDSNPTAPPPSTPPTPELPTRTSYLNEKLSPIFGDLVSDPSTSQFAALSWLAESDPANLPLESTPLSVFQDRFILATLYFSTNGESWTNQYNFLSAAGICDWNIRTLDRTNGVSCDEVDQISIALEENNLVGSFPKELTKFSDLRVLDLASNTVSGTIPESIGDLAALEVLDLASTPMRGTLPASLFNLPKLERLLLSDSDIGGNLPDNIGNASSLRNLFLFSNPFTGTIPTGISELSSLEQVIISFNRGLTGSIPTFEKNVALTICILGDLSLTGSIPPSLGNLPNLQIVSVANNQLTGTVPSFAGNGGSLAELWVGDNLLTSIGDFFESVNPNSLRSIQAHQNRFSDVFPTRIGEFTSLRVLDISDNQLIGTIPTEVGLLPIQFYESIAAAEGTFDVGTNRMSGTLPTELGLLSMADRIDMSNNQFTGTIPREIGNCTNLSRLSLGFNRLEGTVPSEIAALPLTEFLVAGNDGITGDLDASFCSRTTPIDEFWSDCFRSNVICSCCNRCCESSLVSTCANTRARK